MSVCLGLLVGTFLERDSRGDAGYFDTFKYSKMQVPFLNIRELFFYFSSFLRLS